MKNVLVVLSFCCPSFIGAQQKQPAASNKPSPKTTTTLVTKKTFIDKPSPLIIKTTITHEISR